MCVCGVLVEGKLYGGKEVRKGLEEVVKGKGGGERGVCCCGG